MRVLDRIRQAMGWPTAEDRQEAREALAEAERMAAAGRRLRQALEQQ